MPCMVDRRHAPGRRHGGTGRRGDHADVKCVLDPVLIDVTVARRQPELQDVRGDSHLLDLALRSWAVAEVTFGGPLHLVPQLRAHHLGLHLAQALLKTRELREHPLDTTGVAAQRPLAAFATRADARGLREPHRTPPPLTSRTMPR